MKITKIIGIAILSAISAFALYFAITTPIVNKYRKELAQMQESVMNADRLVYTSNNYEDYKIATAVGYSSYPTIKNGQKVLIIARNKIEPKIDDFIALDGNSDKFGSSRHIIKRLKSIDENSCIWIEGDNQSTTWSSLDSKEYGWVCPSDLERPYRIAIPLDK